jgi:hypothetical protein
VAIFVINEWLPEDSSGVNGQKNQREAFTAIVSLAESTHTIVIVERSPFEQKFWHLCKENEDLVIRGIAREYVLGLRQNRERCRILISEETVDIPGELAAATKIDDHYLLSALLTVPGAILVTTDRPLHDAVTDAGLTCLFREEFLQTYV